MRFQTIAEFQNYAKELLKDKGYQYFQDLPLFALNASDCKKFRMERDKVYVCNNMSGARWFVYIIDSDTYWWVGMLAHRQDGTPLGRGINLWHDKEGLDWIKQSTPIKIVTGGGFMNWVDENPMEVK